MCKMVISAIKGFSFSMFRYYLVWEKLNDENNGEHDEIDGDDDSHDYDEDDGNGDDSDGIGDDVDDD